MNKGVLVSLELSDKDVMQIGQMDYKQTQNEDLAQSCVDCVFAKFDGLRQIGCEFNRITAFQKESEVTFVEHKYLKAKDCQKDFLELLDEENYEAYKTNNWLELDYSDYGKYRLATYYDGKLVDLSNLLNEPDITNEYSYYIINGRICNLYRGMYGDWAKIHAEQDLKQIARHEVTLRMSVVIYFGPNNTTQELIDSIHSAKNQTLKPIEVIVLNTNKEVNVSEILDAELFDEDISWRNSKSQWKDADIGLCFDENMRFIAGSYYTLINAGIKLTPEFINKLDISLNEELDRWILLTNKDITVVQTKTTLMLDGFQEIKPKHHNEFIYGIVDKIKHYARPHKTKMVRNLNEVLQVS